MLTPPSRGLLSLLPYLSFSPTPYSHRVPSDPATRPCRLSPGFQLVRECRVTRIWLAQSVPTEVLRTPLHHTLLISPLSCHYTGSVPNISVLLVLFQHAPTCVLNHFMRFHLHSLYLTLPLFVPQISLVESDRAIYTHLPQTEYPPDDAVPPLRNRSALFSVASEPNQPSALSSSVLFSTSAFVYVYCPTSVLVSINLFCITDGLLMFARFTVRTHVAHDGRPALKV